MCINCLKLNKLGNIRLFFLHVSFSNGQDNYVSSILKNRSDPHERGCSFLFLSFFSFVGFFFGPDNVLECIILTILKETKYIYINIYI